MNHIICIQRIGSGKLGMQRIEYFNCAGCAECMTKRESSISPSHSRCYCITSSPEANFSAIYCCCWGNWASARRCIKSDVIKRIIIILDTQICQFECRCCVAFDDAGFALILIFTKGSQHWRIVNILHGNVKSESAGAISSLTIRHAIGEIR